MKIYIETFILDNILMSYLIICASKSLVRLNTRWWGTGLACLMSAAVSVLGMLNPFFLSFSVKAALLCVMTLPFKMKAFKHFLRCAIIVFLITNIFGGLAYSLAFMLEGSFTNGVLYASGSMRLVLVVACASVVIPRILSKLVTAKRVSCYDMELKITTKFGSVFLSARIDTGNGLRTSISDLPVIVVDAKAAKKALPLSWQDGHWADEPVSGLNFVAFKTVGGRGVMPAVPAKVEYKEGKSWIAGLPCCIGMSPHKLHEVDALINAQWLT